MRTDRRLVLLGTESVYGTEATLSAAASALAVIDLQPFKHSLQQDSVEYAKDHLGAGDRWAVSANGGIAFTLPMVSTGTPLGSALPLPLKAAFIACGHSIVDTPATNSIIAPVSTGEGSISLHANLDGYRRKLLGARGNMKWVLEQGKIGRAICELMGLVAAPTDTALTAGTFTALQAPAAFNKANTIVSLGGTPLICSRVEIDSGRTHEHRNIAGDESILNTGQASKASLTIEAPTVAVKNIINELLLATSQALVVTHGTVAGRIMTCTMPKAIPAGDPTESTVNGRLMMTWPLELRPDAGNDAYKWTLT